MGTRREGREAAVQFLFSNELNYGDSLDEQLESFFSICSAKPRVRQFAEELIRGMDGKLLAVGEKLEEHTQNYSVDRISAVDRNILRLAIYELLFVDVPPAVAINEAIEIAKRFGTDKSGQFVNGILDAVRKSLPSKANPR
jgi:N utilization substance protein B